MRAKQAQKLNQQAEHAPKTFIRNASKAYHFSTRAKTKPNRLNMHPKHLLETQARPTPFHTELM